VFAQLFLIHQVGAVAPGAVKEEEGFSLANFQHLYLGAGYSDHFFCPVVGHLSEPPCRLVVLGMFVDFSGCSGSFCGNVLPDQLCSFLPKTKGARKTRHPTKNMTLATVPQASPAMLLLVTNKAHPQRKKSHPSN
jgi:hypothetical protein